MYSQRQGRENQANVLMISEPTTALQLYSSRRQQLTLSDQLTRPGKLRRQARDLNWNQSKICWNQGKLQQHPGYLRTDDHRPTNRAVHRDFLGWLQISI